jgi:hypothetical protein
MIELACPESCPYLIEARTNASQREMALRRQETAQHPRDLMLNDAALLVLDAIGGAIVSAQRSVGASAFRGLDDSDVLAAVEIAIKNLETEESGLIYEHRAAAHRVDELSHRIRGHIDEIGKDQPADTRPRRSEIFKALTFTRNAVKAHTLRAPDDPESSRTFIRYTALFYPWPEQATRPLIV